jgi:hypothetical protein
MTSISRLQRKQNALQHQYDLLSEKIERLRAAHAIEAAAAPRFQLEKQIEQAESEFDAVEQQLDELEAQLERAASTGPGQAAPPAAPATATRALDREYLIRLRQTLTARFDVGELRTLCFDLGVDYDDLPGQGRASKARELIRYLERRDRIPDLVSFGGQMRPDISWPQR